MSKYCGVISIGATDGGGYVTTGSRDPLTGQHHATSAIPIAVQLIGLRIGDTYFRKIRVCQQFVAQFLHPGDNACIYVYKQLGITDVIIGVRSSGNPSYAISPQRLLLMLFSQFVFGALFGVIPAFILFGWISSTLALLSLLVLPACGSWSLYKAYQEMSLDFS
jgi:hypothetical protein